MAVRDRRPGTARVNLVLLVYSMAPSSSSLYGSSCTSAVSPSPVPLLFPLVASCIGLFLASRTAVGHGCPGYKNVQEQLLLRLLVHACTLQILHARTYKRFHAQ